jgi:hypothetical protein
MAGEADIMSVMRREDWMGIGWAALFGTFVVLNAIVVSGMLHPNPSETTAILSSVWGGGAIVFVLATLGGWRARALGCGFVAFAVAAWIERGSWLPHQLFAPLAASGVLVWVCAVVKRWKIGSLDEAAVVAVLLGLLWVLMSPSWGMGIAYDWKDVDLVFRDVGAWTIGGGGTMGVAALAYRLGRPRQE